MENQMNGSMEEWLEAIRISKNHIGHHVRELTDKGCDAPAAKWLELWRTLKFDGADDEPIIPSWVPDCVRSPQDLINCACNLVYLSKQKHL